MTTPTAEAKSPQAQAEAMASQICQTWLVKGELDTTALSKLIEENVDRLRRVYLDYGDRELLLRDEISKLIEENEMKAEAIAGYERQLCLKDGETIGSTIANLQSQLAATQKENERLVNDSRNDCARYDDIAAKLTATEAENERLKARWDYPGPRSIGNEFKVEWREDDMRHYVYDKDGKFIYSGEPRFTAYYVADVIQKLTATEARLEKAQWLLTEAVEYKFMYQESADFDDGLPEQIRAFLSTLTAEKTTK